MKHETIAAAAPSRAAGAGVWRTNLRDYGLLASLLVIMAFFEFLTSGVLLAPVNITNLILTPTPYSQV